MTQATLTPSPFAVFRRRDFRLLFSAQFVSSAGSGLTTVAASILVFQLTGSAWSVGLMLMATALPSLLVGLVAGVFVDRYDRRQIMVVAQLARAVLVGCIPLLMSYGVVWVYVLVMLSSAVDTFFAPAQASVLPETAPDEELAAANALMTISDCTALTLGYAGAGLLAGAGLIAWAFWLDALSYLAAAGCIALMRVRSTPAEGSTSVAAIVANLREGLTFVRDTAVLRSMFLVFIPVFALFGLENTLLLPFAERALGVGELEYGLLEAVATIGFVLGGFVLVLYTDRIHAGQWVVGSFIAMGLSGIALALTSSIWPALVLNGLHGLLNTPSYVGRSLIMQRNTPREARGRVFGAFAVVRDTSLLLGMGAAGLADVLDVRVLLLASSAALLGVGVLALRMPGLGQPSVEWRRAFRMLRTAPQSPTLGLGRAALPGDITRLAAALPAFGTMSERQRRELAQVARVHTVPAGAAVIRRDEPSDAAYFLLEGRTIALAGDEDGEVLETHGPGDFFGEIAALTGGARTATVVADQPVLLLQVPAAALRPLIEHSQVRALLLGKLAERVLRLQLRGASRLGGGEQDTLRELWAAPAPSPATSAGVQAGSA